jgi:hypothetical protein
MSRPTRNPNTYPLTSLLASGSPSIHPLDNDPSISASSPFAAQEALLAESNHKLASADALSDAAKQEAVLLKQIADLLKKSAVPSKVEFIWNQILQLVGICFVIVFGTFAVLAYNVAVVANKQSLDANQLSLLSVCLSNEVCLRSVPCFPSVLASEAANPVPESCLQFDHAECNEAFGINCDGCLWNCCSNIDV